MRLDSHSTFHKLSVLPRDKLSCAIVNLDANRVKCQSGLCSSRRGHNRKLTLLGSKDDCPHLHVLHEHIDVWQHLLPGSTATNSSVPDSEVECDVHNTNQHQSKNEPIPGRNDKTLVSVDINDQTNYFYLTILHIISCK